MQPTSARWHLLAALSRAQISPVYAFSARTERRYSGERHFHYITRREARISAFSFISRRARAEDFCRQARAFPFFLSALSLSLAFFEPVPLRLCRGPALFLAISGRISILQSIFSDVPCRKMCLSTDCCRVPLSGELLVRSGLFGDANSARVLSFFSDKLPRRCNGHTNTSCFDVQSKVVLIDTFFLFLRLSGKNVIRIVSTLFFKCHSRNFSLYNIYAEINISRNFRGSINIAKIKLEIRIAEFFFFWCKEQEPILLCHVCWKRKTLAVFFRIYKMQIYK